MSAQDMRGRKIRVGDTIAYGLMIGRSANLAVYRVVGVKDTGRTDRHYDLDTREVTERPVFNVTAQKLQQSYGGAQEKPSSLLMCRDRALVINETAATW